jgi:hypothetical protein
MLNSENDEITSCWRTGSVRMLMSFPSSLAMYLETKVAISLLMSGRGRSNGLRQNGQQGFFF